MKFLLLLLLLLLLSFLSFSSLSVLMAGYVANEDRKIEVENKKSTESLVYRYKKNQDSVATAGVKCEKLYCSLAK